MNMKEVDKLRRQILRDYFPRETNTLSDFYRGFAKGIDATLSQVAAVIHALTGKDK